MSHLVSEHPRLLLFLESVLETFQLTISKGDEAYEITISVHLPPPYSTQQLLSSMASFKPEGYRAQRNKVPTHFMKIEAWADRSKYELSLPTQSNWLMLKVNRLLKTQHTSNRELINLLLMEKFVFTGLNDGWRIKPSRRKRLRFKWKCFQDSMAIKAGIRDEDVSQAFH